MDTRQHKLIRSSDQLENDFVLPYRGLCGIVDRRFKAIVENLCILPATDYKRFKEKISELHWFVPTDDELGMAYSFPSTIFPPEKKVKSFNWFHTQKYFILAHF